MGDKKNGAYQMIEVPAEVLVGIRTSLTQNLEKAAKDLCECLHFDSVHIFVRCNRYEVYGKQKTAFTRIGTFGMTQLPGCCGAIVFHNVEITEDFRHQGLGRFFYRMRETAARAAGYTLLFATVLVRNSVERHILEAEGWTVCKEFTNHRTKNDIMVYTKVI